MLIYNQLRSQKKILNDPHTTKITLRKLYYGELLFSSFGPKGIRTPKFNKDQISSPNSSIFSLLSIRIKDKNHSTDDVERFFTAYAPTEIRTHFIKTMRPGYWTQTIMLDFLIKLAYHNPQLVEFFPLLKAQ